MPSEISTIIDLLSRPEFHAGLAAGTIAFACLLLTPSTLRDWGLAVALATSVAAFVVGLATGGFLFGIGLLALGGVLVHRTRHASDAALRALSWIVIIAGALVVPGMGGVARSLWLQTFTSALILVGGYLLCRWGLSERFHLLGILFAITAAGIWLTIPETEGARALLGVSLVLAATTLPIFRTRLTAAGAFPLVGVAAWVVATGGIAREASIIGGWACLGLLIILPLLGVDRAGMRDWIVVLFHGIFVIIASRVVGMWESAAIAMVAIAIVSGLSIGTIRVLTPNPDQGPR